jgi:hypothetical protein
MLERVSKMVQDALAAMSQGLRPDVFLALFGTTEVVP